MKRGPHVEINKKHLRHNFRLLKGLSNNNPVICVVKANAYGHGIVECSKALVDEGARAFGVAFNEEAITLRESGVDNQIIVFFDEINPEDIIKYKLTPVLYNLKSAKELSKWAKKKNNNVNAHINIDTGMGRIGYLHDVGLDDIKQSITLDNLNITGFMSHFCDADLANLDFANGQIKKFLNVKNQLINLQKNAIWHIANSAASLTMPDAHLDAIRPGLCLYGCNPLTYDNGEGFNLKPVMTVKSNILELRRMPEGRAIGYGQTFITERDSLIGVLPFGYADGFLRTLSNQCCVLVKGQKAPIVGRICMDTTMIDLTDIKDEVHYNDEVVIIGKQGENEIKANDLAKIAKTISYEILILFGRLNR